MSGMKSLIIATLLVGCASNGDCVRESLEGPVDCRLPVMAAELDGKWCDNAPGQLLCLEAYNGDSYAWLGGDCFEVGQLSGGLEFQPYDRPNHRRCFGDDSSLYSASVRWTATGLTLEVDGYFRPLSLSYVAK